MTKKGSTYLILMAALMLLVLASDGLAHGQTPEGTAVPESTPLQTPAGTIESKLEEASSLLDTPQTESDTSEQGSLLDGTVPTRTPVPTATPSAVQEVVSDVAGMIGLDEITLSKSSFCCVYSGGCLNLPRNGLIRSLTRKTASRN